jgi:hypothetical protein
MIHKQDYDQSQKFHSAPQEWELDLTLKKNEKKAKLHISIFYKENKNP